MTRRSFLAALLAVLVMPKRAGADPSSLKGFCANAEAPAAVNPLAPDWVNIELGAWSGNLAFDYGATKFALNVSNLSLTEIQQCLPNALLHPSYDHWFILLNEPSEGFAPQQAADIVNSQLDVITGIDPLAKCCLSAGTGLHPIYKANSYLQQLFPLIVKKRFIKAFGATFYPYDGAPSFHKFVLKSRNYLDLNYATRDLWILECGQVIGQAPETLFSMDVVEQECENRVARWAWYAQQAIPNTPAAGYDCLLDAAGNRTALGQMF
jgi:hypothetical protein